MERTKNNMERIKKLEEDIATIKKGKEKLRQELIKLQEAAESGLSADNSLSKFFGNEHAKISKSILEGKIAFTREAIEQFESEQIKMKSELARLIEETK